MGKEGLSFANMREVFLKFVCAAEVFEEIKQKLSVDGDTKMIIKRFFEICTGKFEVLWRHFSIKNFFMRSSILKRGCDHFAGRKNLEALQSFWAPWKRTSMTREQSGNHAKEKRRKKRTLIGTSPLLSPKDLRIVSPSEVLPRAFGRLLITPNWRLGEGPCQEVEHIPSFLFCVALSKHGSLETHSVVEKYTAKSREH